MNLGEKLPVMVYHLDRDYFAINLGGYSIKKTEEYFQKIQALLRS